MVGVTAHKILTAPSDALAAQEVLDGLNGRAADLAVRVESVTVPVPEAVTQLLRSVLNVVANGGSVTVTSMPAELTSSMAADLLGVSRPTVIKMAHDGLIASHKVGTHTRFALADVMAVQQARRERERAAFAELRELDI